MTIEWWHWIVLGVALMLLELAAPAVFLIWFGLGAIVVGLLVAVVPSLAPWAQLLLWTLCSVAALIVWTRVFKASVHRTRVGLSEGQFAGEIGLVTRPIRPFEKGQIRFQKPIMGAEVWEAISDQDLPAGERVRVLDVEGSLLRVVAEKR